MVEEVTPLQEEGKKSIVPDGAQKKWFWMMAGIIACGALIRIAAAVGNGRFWFDEIITWEIAARPWSEMGKYLAMENHPPLHYLIVAAWMRLFGAGEIVVKMSSVLAGALGIWVTGLFGKRLFGARAGLWAAGITALSTYHIFFSAEARMYPWLYLFGTLSLADIPCDGHDSVKFSGRSRNSRYAQLRREEPPVLRHQRVFRIANDHGA